MEGPEAGADGVVLAVSPATTSWAATSGDHWLHLSATNRSGAGSANVIFTFDANPGATRTGTITVAGLGLKVTQAGGTYVPVYPLTTLVSSGLNYPDGVAVDASGNVYFADTYNSAIKKWSAADGSVATLLSSELYYPLGVAVDFEGNVYIVDEGDHSIKMWNAARGTLNTLVSSGLYYPEGVAVDEAGNVYIVDSGDDSVKKWSANRGTLSTLVSSGLNNPRGVAVDAAENVYIADSGNNQIKEWAAATGMVTTLVSSGLNNPEGVAVDGAGNVYFVDDGKKSIKKWSAVDGGVTTLVSSGLPSLNGVAVDGAGNLFVVDNYRKAIVESPRAFVDRTDKWETAATGGDVLPAVLPVGANLTGSFAPTSDQSWLTVIGVTNGVASFAFTTNVSFSRSARITLLGTNIVVTQAGSVTAYLNTTGLAETGAAGSASVSLIVSSPNLPWTGTANDSWLHLSPASGRGVGDAVVVFTFDANIGPLRTGTLTIAGQTLTVTQNGGYALGTSTLLEGPAAGVDSVVLVSGSSTDLWTATANDSWLHLNATNESGTSSATVIFTFDVNRGPTRMGTLTVAGRPLTVTQAGATYVAADALTTLISYPPVYLDGNPELNCGIFPAGVAVDCVGNVYIVGAQEGPLGFYEDAEIDKWTAATGAITRLGIPFFLITQMQVAVDCAGNVFCSSYWWFTDGLQMNFGEISASTGDWAPLLSPDLGLFAGVAADSAGNVYAAVGDDCVDIYRLSAAGGAVTELFRYCPSQAQYFWSWDSPRLGLAADGAGNVYIVDPGDGSVTMWSAAHGTLTTLVSSGLQNPQGLAVDGAGNVYIADSGNNQIKKWAAATGMVTTLVSSGLNNPVGLAVDGEGNIYIADNGNQAVEELLTPFVDPIPKFETAAAGNDVLPVVLPATVNLARSGFSPASDQPWLTITGFDLGVVGYSFTANPTLAPRSAHIMLLGRSIPVTQAGAEEVAFAGSSWLPGGDFQFSFTGTPGAAYSVLFSTNVALPPSQWTVLGTATNTAPGRFQFTAQPPAGARAGFYRVQ